MLSTPPPNIMPLNFDLEHYCPIGEAAGLLGLNADHLGRKCHESLAAKHLAVRAVPPNGGQEQWFILRSYDPRLAYQRPAEAEPDLTAYSLKQQAGARARRECVETLRRAKREWTGKIQEWLPGLIDNLKRKFPELALSRSRLYAWDKDYCRPEDLERLVDTRGGDRVSQGGLEAWNCFKDLYLHPSQPSIKQCWQETSRIAQERGWTWCSLKSCHSQINDRIPKETQIQHRDPATYRHALEPFIEQDPEAWRAGQCWIGDHKQLDCWCSFNEKLIRPWLTAWMDWRTRRLAGWVLSDNPNSSTILAALRHGLLDAQNLGGPAVVWIDNGKDYDAWVFHGQTKRERLRRLDTRLDEGFAQGIFRSLQIDPHFSLAYNPNGKARLERWFRTLEAFCRTFETYAGNSVETRPERLNEVLQNPGKVPPFQEVYQRIGQHIAGYNLRSDHEIDDLGENGQRLCPDEALARWCTTKRVWADPAALDLLLQQWKKPTVVGRNGIAVAIQGQMIHYGQFEAALRPFKALKKSDRNPVNVAFDPHDVRQIRVYDEGFNFVCTARMNARGGLHGGDAISQEQVAELNRQKAIYNKATRHVAEHSLASVLTNEERLAMLAAKAKDSQQAAQDDPERSLRIVQTPLDGQAKEVQREQFRKAVGAESLSGDGEGFGLSAFEKLRRSQQQRRAAIDEDEGFVRDPLALLRRGSHARGQ